jgi:MoaA/NifB/PqqE/SkfB family radical SAM enzyme
MGLQGLDLLLTYKCVSACEHCLYCARPQAEGVMTLEDARTYLEQAGSIRWISIHGGEPFLYFDTLIEVVKTAKRMGIDDIWVMTNCYWAKSIGPAKDRLTALKNAGCSHIWFSADAFHQAFIPLERVKTALEAAKGLNFPSIILNSLFLGDERDDNTYNTQTRKIIAELGDMKDVITRWEPFSIGVSLSVVGRAAEHLACYLKKKEVPQGKCVLPPYLGDLESPDAFEIDPFGWVLLCPGVSVGNAKKKPLSEIIEDYDPSTIPVLKKVREEGPKGLLKEAVAKGYTPGTYVNECHLCYDVRKYLRKDYPNLAPEICYTV